MFVIFPLFELTKTPREPREGTPGRCGMWGTHHKKNSSSRDLGSNPARTDRRFSIFPIRATWVRTRRERIRFLTSLAVVLDPRDPGSIPGSVQLPCRPEMARAAGLAPQRCNERDHFGITPMDVDRRRRQTSAAALGMVSKIPWQTST